MLKEIILSITAYRYAHEFIVKYRLWKWIIPMGIVYCLLFMGGIFLFTHFAQAILNRELMVTLGIRNLANRLNVSWLNFLLSFTGFIVWLVLLLFYSALFKYIWLLLGIPFFKALGRQVIRLLDPQAPIAQFSNNHAVKMALRNALWQSVYLLAFFVVALVPIVGWVVPLFILLMECYYYGFSMIDYFFAAKKVSVTNSARFSAAHKGFAMGNGLFFYIFHLLPILGWVLAPGYALVAALQVGNHLNDE